MGWLCGLGTQNRPASWLSPYHPSCASRSSYRINDQIDVAEQSALSFTRESSGGLCT